MNDSRNEQKQITDHSSNCIDLTNDDGSGNGGIIDEEEDLRQAITL